MMFSFCRTQPLPTVQQVDLKKYAGTWYEIAAYETSFEKNCKCITAKYTLTQKNYVLVENSCVKTTKANQKTSVSGKAFVVPNSGNAKLLVQFFWPFKGKYWIIDLAPDYSYAVVGHPNRKYLWILSRTPTLNENTYAMLLEKIKSLGFDCSKLHRTIQEDCEL